MSIFTPKGHLDNKEIRKRLLNIRYPQNKKLSEKVVDDIVQKFWLRDIYNSLISDPVFYNILEEYLTKNYLTSFSRPEFYNFFFKKIASNDQLISLKKLALVFELLHSDRTSLNEFNGILTNTEFKPLTLKWLIENHLVKEEKNQVIWIHHTLTEFLTAEVVLVNSKPIEVFKRLAFISLDKSDNALKPSWYGVLRFLIENQQSLILDWLVKQIKINNKIIDDDLADIITSIDPDSLSPSLKSAIFETIYAIYRERKLWLSYLTRSNLYKFFNPKFHKSILENDLKETKDETETYVKRGNVVAIFEGIFRNNPELFSSKEVKIWRTTIIKFANDPNKNGVLQRHSLSALGVFKDPTIIPEVSKSLDSGDNLIQEAFIQLCLETDPNSPKIIDQIVVGLKKGISIYGRHALYSITSPQAIRYLIENHFLKDEDLLKRFLDKESIFNSRDEKADDQLLQNIKNALNNEPGLLSLLKKLLIGASNLAAHNYFDNSYFLSQLGLIVLSKDKNLIFDILADIQSKPNDFDKWHLFNNYKQLFADIIQPEDLEKFMSLAKIFTRNEGVISFVVGYAKRNRGLLGLKIWNIAKEKHLLSDQFFNPTPETDYVAQRNQKIYEEFKNHLEPAPKKYIPDVFSLYAANPDVLNNLATKKEMDRLLYLVVDEGIKKIDPSKFIVRISKRSEGSGGQFTWSSQAQYFGDIIRVVKLLKPILLEDYSQNIINFIPYAFSDDLGLILEVIPRISDADLKWVNQAYRDEEHDQRYLIPSTYTYLIDQYLERGCHLKSSVKVLRSFLDDQKIEESTRLSALKTLGKLLKPVKANYDYFDWLFKRAKQKDENYASKVREISNDILITVYKDQNAIDWRFDQIKQRIGPFDSKSKLAVHSVGPFENELDTLAFATPLINLQDPKYLDKFLGLLKFSVEKSVKKGKEYWEYTNYVWRIVFAYLEKLKSKGSFESLLKAEKWILKYGNQGESNWLKARLFQTRLDYLNDLGRVKSIDSALTLLKEVEVP